MKKLIFTLIIAAFILSACSGGSAGIFPTAVPTATLPNPQVTITAAPDARAAMTAFLEAYAVEDYTNMYAMLSRLSREATLQEDFDQRHKDALNAMSLQQMNFEILSVLTNPNSAQVAYRMTYSTALAGEIVRDMTARWVLEDEIWRLQWDEGLILPELIGGNKLAMDCKVPSRGDIYDRNGDPIVSQANAVALGVIPGQINLDTEGTLLSQLSRLTGKTTQEIYASYEGAGAQWYVPVGEATEAEAERVLNMNLGGLFATPYQARYYFDGGIAQQAVGYTITIPAEELEEYQRRGYCGYERVGYSGLEKWGEDYLSGVHGGSLYVVNADGQIVTRLAQTEAEPASSLYLTIDKNLQYYAQSALKGFSGAAVVIERDTGRVLAMASSPDFDPNFFEPENINNQALPELLNNFEQPLFNRAAQGAYPLGSVFKVITMSAALSSGLYTAETTYECGYDYIELPDRVLHDWTWEHCQDEIEYSRLNLEPDEEPLTVDTCYSQPSGNLTLPEALMRSCNPWFWHIGLDLYTSERYSDVANMARAFGLGQATGIGQVAESAGLIEDPADPIQAVNQAIGQGTVQVTPLQVATFMAAIGNGGTIYRPQLIEEIQTLSGQTSSIFKPEARSTLPLSDEYLQILEDAMISVVSNQRGTAYLRLRSLRSYGIPVAGKTGTAESGSGLPHAWFAGYTMANENTGLPDIAIAVIVENAGEGSDYAAPVFQRIVETYYFGSPRTTYWFESSFGVTKTPTPIGGIPTEAP